MSAGSIETSSAKTLDSLGICTCYHGEAPVDIQVASATVRVDLLGSSAKCCFCTATSALGDRPGQRDMRRARLSHDAVHEGALRAPCSRSALGGEGHAGAK